MMWMVYTLMFFILVAAISSAFSFTNSDRKNFGVDFIRFVIFVATFLIMFYLIK